MFFQINDEYFKKIQRDGEPNVNKEPIENILITVLPLNIHPLYFQPQDQNYFF